MRTWWLTILLLACQGDTEGEPTETELGTSTGCDPLDPSLCALPWPSSYFETEAETVTGVRLDYGPDALPENLDGVQLRPDAWNEKDGFSAMTPIVTFFDDVSLDGVIPHTDLDAYLAADAKTVILDAETGERVPHFVELDTSVEQGEQLLWIRPVVPLRHATRYVVGIRGLTTNAGGPVAVSPAFAALRDGTSTSDPDVEGRRQRFDDEVFPVLEADGFARSELQLAWDFHTVSEDSSLGRMLWMRDDVLERVGTSGPPYTIETVEEYDCSVEGEHVWRHIEGRLTVPQYTDISVPGAVLTRGDDGMPYYNGDTSVGFMLRIPCSLYEDPTGGGRVLQYGHGLLGSYGEAKSSYLAELIDENRWVLLAQNWTGMSELDAGAISLMLVLDMSDFHMIPERSMQGFTELMAGLRMVRGDLAADEDLLVDGVSVVSPDLDPVYYGNSQGAILGGAYLALSTDIDRGVLGVGGMPYSLLLSRSADFDPFFKMFEQKFDDGKQIGLLLAAIQTLWDPGEAAGYAWQMNQDPLPDTDPKQVLLQVAVGDAQVTTLGAHVMARAYGASTVAPQTRPVWGVEEQATPFEGSALVEWIYTDGSTEPETNTPPAKEGDTHECPRREPAAQAQLVEFAESGTITQHCDGICEGTRAGLCD